LIIDYIQCITINKNFFMLFNIYIIYTKDFQLINSHQFNTLLVTVTSLYHMLALHFSIISSWNCLSVRLHLSGRKTLPATLNKRSTWADDARMVLSLLDVGFIMNSLQKKFWKVSVMSIVNAVYRCKNRCGNNKFVYGNSKRQYRLYKEIIIFLLTLQWYNSIHYNIDTLSIILQKNCCI
jgi:hypothetical protein